MANILLVEDDKDLAFALRQILILDDHEVRTANNGEEALQLLRALHPDLVITDVEMPILDGPGLAYRMFLEDCGMERIPIVIASGFSELLTVAQHIGTPYYLSKPFEIEALLCLVHRALTEKTPPARAANAS